MNKKQLALLKSITDSKQLFDKRDNTIINTNRTTAEILGVSKDSVNRLMRSLVVSGNARKVTAINSRKNPDGSLQATTQPRVEVFMLNPEFYCEQQVRIERHFMNVMYYLGSHDEAIEFTKTERKLNQFINPYTGELIPMSMDAQTSYEKYIYNYVMDRATKHRDLTERKSTYRCGDDGAYPAMNGDELGVWGENGFDPSDSTQNSSGKKFYPRRKTNIDSIEIPYDPEIKRLADEAGL